jgi:Ras-related protein Rab-1A
VRFAENIFSDNYISTIGVDFKIKTLEVNGKTVKMQVWDTAGQERFRTITASYYRGSNGIIIVYDVTNRDSFDHVSFWIKEIERLAAPDVVKILVGNKCDLTEKRVVTTEEGQVVAARYGIKFMETSALTNSNVDDAFTEMAKLQPATASSGGGGPVLRPLGPAKPVGGSSGCC